MSWHAFLEMKRKGTPRTENGPTPDALSAKGPASAAWQSAAWQSAAWQSAAWQSAASSEPKAPVDGVDLPRNQCAPACFEF